jgi:hypothetical protein
VVDIHQTRGAIVSEPFNPGERVEVLDRGNNTYQPATVVSLEVKTGTIGDPYDKPGYVVRYDNGCEVWVRAYSVSAMRDIFADARTCVCGALAEQVDSGEGPAYWAHVKRMRIAYDHAAVPQRRTDA